ncbi:MAG: hypothetical protein ACYTCU_02030 [Planctomycetota bacterium]|jgi:hypothetical protein
MTDKDLITRAFQASGLPRRSVEPGMQCPSDDDVAGYLESRLPERDRQLLEAHSLQCGECHEVLKSAVDAIGVAAPAPIPASVRILGRLARHGIELLNHVDLAIRSLGEGTPAPALGALRGTTEALPTSEMVVLSGPGNGLDELELQVQSNGATRLSVRCAELPELRAGEVVSVILEVDGTPREKRPLSGDAISFAPLGPGHYCVRLTARAPGCPPRELSQAIIDLKS